MKGHQWSSHDVVVIAEKTVRNVSDSNLKTLNSRCGKYKIFLVLTFYVKSILKNLEALELPFMPL